MKNDKPADPLQFQNSILKSSMTIDNLTSVIALSIAGNSETERKENAKRLATLVSKFFNQKVEHCEHQTRKLLGGARHWISNNKRSEIIIDLWDNRYSAAVSSKLYTSEEAYRRISEDMEESLPTSLYTVRTIVNAHIREKKATQF